MARYWYEAIALLDRHGEILFLNHGYAPLDPAEPPLPLDPDDEPHRFAIQLYHHVASGADWTGRDALEIASGRGGGSAYLMRTFKPRSLVGIDLAASGINFSQRHYVMPGLSFRHGNAMALPLEDASVDIVINVESSNNFPDKKTFLREVMRVLRPGGCFLLGDYRMDSNVHRLPKQLKAAGFEFESERNISANIVKALELDNDRKQAIIDAKVPRPLRKIVKRFAFVRGGGEDEQGAFETGGKIYLCYVLRKPRPA